MGKLDYRTGVYFSNENRFADFCNGVLYGGQQVIKPEELSDADSEYIFAKGKKSKKILVDLAKYWNGKYLRLIFIENQTYVDYRMVFRNMLSEALAYERQWRKKKAMHDREKDLQGDEFLSGMSKDEKFIPVISIVVYYGKNPWDGARCLYDLLDIGEDMVVRGLISNYQLNLFDYHDYKDFDMFQTEIKILFETLRYAEKRNELEDRYIEDEMYKSITNETIELISELTTIDISKNRINQKEEKEMVDLQKAWDEQLEYGRKLEVIRMIEKIIEKKGGNEKIAEYFSPDNDSIDYIRNWYDIALEVNTAEDFIKKLNALKICS